MDRFRLDAAVRDEHEPRLIYKFESLVGQRKSELVKTLDLENLRQHLPEVTNRLTGTKVVEDSCLSSLADPDEPLRLLYAIEYGAVGLEGNPQTHPESSRWYMAMEAQGVSLQDAGRQSGGSWGFGKAAFELGSRVATVVAYSRFREDETGVTTRLGGYIHQAHHKCNDITYTGFASFGVSTALGAGEYQVVPFENSQADEYAGLLGMTRKELGTVNDLGTTFLIVDPALEPSDLLEALETYWWPTILDEDLDISVIDYDDVEYTPRPKRSERSDLAPYLEAWNLLRGISNPRPETQKIVPFQQLPDGRSLGQLSLVSDPATCFDRVPAESGEESSTKIALVRQRGMVIKYENFFINRPPFVHGVLYTHSDIEEPLSKIEPKEHNRWWLDDSRNRTLQSWKDEWRDVVQALYSRTYSNVNLFRRSLSRDIDEDSVILSRLAKNIGRLLRHKKKRGRPDPPDRPGRSPASLQIPPRGVSRAPLAGGGYVATQDVAVSLAGHVSQESAEARVRVDWNYRLDTSSNGARIPTTYEEVPQGWRQEGDHLVGVLTKREIRFKAKSGKIDGPYEVRVTGHVNVDLPRTGSEGE